MDKFLLYHTSLSILKPEKNCSEDLEFFATEKNWIRIVKLKQ